MANLEFWGEGGPPHRLMTMMEMIRLTIFERPLVWVQSTGTYQPPSAAHLVLVLAVCHVGDGMMALSCTVVYAGDTGGESQ